MSQTQRTGMTLDEFLDCACRPFGSALKIRTAQGAIRYPDVLVICEPALPLATVVENPKVIFEILSDSEAAIDKTEKLVEYLATPSIERYVMLEQRQPFATVVSRSETGWSLQVLGASGTLAMPEIGVEIPMAELYRGIAFPEPEPAA